MPVAGPGGSGRSGRPETDETDAGPSGEKLSIPELANEYVVRREDLDFEEAGSCCCYGPNNAALDVIKRRARVIISDARTSEVLAEKVFDPPKTCPNVKDLTGIEPTFSRSVPASVVEAWAKQRVRELQRKRRQEVSPRR